MEETVYGIWLQRALGEGSRKVPPLLAYFGSCRGVYESDAIERQLSGLLSPREMGKMADTPLDEAEEIMEACGRLGYQVITPDCDNYPNRLRNIPDYPAALYICGEWGDVDEEVCIGMVGTRNASRFGYGIASELARDFAICGAIVVSGGAKGIDTASHQGAIMAGGRTFAVLGCGINTHYNMSNEGLRKVISTNGALISEYPPGTAPFGYHFPVRNRLISALSLGVVVVEAGMKSGSLITAELAVQQGKELFAVSDKDGRAGTQGVERLIAQGAKPVDNARDVLDEFVGLFPHKLRTEKLGSLDAPVYSTPISRRMDRERAEKPPSHRPRKASKPTEKAVVPVPVREAPAAAEQESAERYPVGMSENACRIIRALDTAPRTFQELSDSLALSASELMRCITELELYGAVRTLPGKRYMKN